MQSDTPQITVRKAELTDLAYIDSLQKRFSHEVGFFAASWISEYIKRWFVSLALLNGEPAAYLLGRDTSRFDASVGRVYQTAVQMDARHVEIGRALVEHYAASMPESTTSIALFCAQDIQANLFWDALGFKAVGFREGSRNKGRVHILWQRSTRPDEDPLFVSIPETTSGGLLRDQRIVMPLEPGQTWRDVRLVSVQRNAIVTHPERPRTIRRNPRNRPLATEIFVIPKNKIAIVVGGRIKHREKSSAHP